MNFSPELNIGVGLIPLGNGAGGVSNTYLIKDWY